MRNITQELRSVADKTNQMTKEEFTSQSTFTTSEGTISLINKLLGRLWESASQGEYRKAFRIEECEQEVVMESVLAIKEQGLVGYWMAPEMGYSCSYSFVFSWESEG